MMRHVFGVLASVALATTSATAALACGSAQQSSTPNSGMTSATEQPMQIGEEERMDEVAGVRIVPSVIAKQVSLTPSAWIHHDAESRMASANAKVYTDNQGAITGVTITSWGLPNPERINPRFSDYVVWLVDTDTNQVMNIGTLESKNGGQAVFGYSPQAPLVGFDKIVITPEHTFATSWPVGWEQLSGDIPMTAAVPTMPTAPAMPE